MTQAEVVRREKEVRKLNDLLAETRRKNQLVQDKVQEQIQHLHKMLEEHKAEHQRHEESIENDIIGKEQMLFNVKDSLDKRRKMLEMDEDNQSNIEDESLKYVDICSLASFCNGKRKYCALKVSFSERVACTQHLVSMSKMPLMLVPQAQISRQWTKIGAPRPQFNSKSHLNCQMTRAELNTLIRLSELRRNQILDILKYPLKYILENVQKII